MRSKPSGSTGCAPSRMRSCSFITDTASGAFSTMSRDVIGEGLKLLKRHDVVDHANIEGAGGADWLCRERHFAHGAHRCGVEKGQHAGNVVGYAELRRRDGEGGVRRDDDDVAGEHDLARPAPNAAFHHGDDGRGKLLYRAHEMTHRIVPAKRVAMGHRQLKNIVTGRPHTRAGQAQVGERKLNARGVDGIGRLHIAPPSSASSAFGARTTANSS